MHKLINATGRRGAGVAAGVVLAGGLAGGVLLLPGTAYAATTNTSTAITGTSQQGTSLDVQVSVTASGPGWPSGTVVVSDGSDSCSAALTEAGHGSVGVGSCSLSGLSGLSGGSYTLTASYQGSAQFSGSSTSDTVRIGNAGHYRASVTTSLSCPSSVKTNTQGKCTLYVTNNGTGYASDVSAQIALPSQLQAKYCGSYGTWNYNWNSGCSISGNTAYENIGTLSQGQTKELTVVFTAKTGYNLWGWHRGYRWPVKVTGSASANNGFPFYGQSSSSSAYVTIIPQGWWA